MRSLLIATTLLFAALLAGFWLQQTPEADPEERAEASVARVVDGARPRAVLEPAAPPASPEPAPAAGALHPLAEMPDDGRAPDISDRAVERHAFAVDIVRLNGLSAGDVLPLALSGLPEDLEIFVEDVRMLPTGNKAITGLVDGVPSRPFTMTIGPGQLFGTFGTERGVYSLKGSHDYLWVFPVAQLRAHIDTSVPDYRVRTDEQTYTTP